MSGQDLRVVIGLGNDLRRDDGFGPAVLRRLRDEPRLAEAGVRLVDCDGEPTRLMEAWTGADLAVVVDALHCAGPVGLRYELDPSDISPLRPAFSSHGVGLAEIVELAEALHRLPRYLVVLAAVGCDFSHGEGLTPALGAAVGPVAARAAALVLA